MNETTIYVEYIIQQEKQLLFSFYEEVCFYFRSTSSGHFIGTRNESMISKCR